MSDFIEVESWSDGSGTWVYYGKFETKEEIDKYLKDNGYDPRYFRLV